MVPIIATITAAMATPGNSSPSVVNRDEVVDGNVDGNVDGDIF